MWPLNKKTELKALEPKAKNPAASVLYNNYAVEKIFTALQSLPDPDEQLRKVGMSRHRLSIMEYDDEISAALETRREAVVITPWRLEFGTGETSPQVEFIWEEIEPLMPTLLENAWTALPYGYGVQEAIYNKKPGNKIGIERMEGKPMEWFEPLRDGKLKMNKPGNALSEEVDTVRKFCLTRRRPTYKNPYGEALLSRLFWPWQFRHTGWEHWMKFLERFGDPLLLAKANDPKAMLEVMQQAGFYTAVAGFTSDDIKAVTPGAGDGFEKADQILQKRIQRVILGQNLTSEVKGGSLAATQAHMEVKEDKRQADIRLVKPAAQWLINSLWHLNGFEGEPPLIVFEDETGLELERSERDSNLKSSGVVKGFTSQYLLRVYDFEDGDFLLDDGTDDDDKGKVTGLSVKLSADQGFTKDQQAVEDGVAEILDGIPDPIPVDLIRSAVLAAKSPADLEDRLAALLDAKDPEFTELLARASFAAEILGYVQERENG